jgi:hypothetical protein
VKAALHITSGSRYSKKQSCWWGCRSAVCFCRWLGVVRAVDQQQCSMLVAVAVCSGDGFIYFQCMCIFLKVCLQVMYASV